MYGGLQPFWAVFDLVVEHGEHPYFASLEPYELVCVIYTSVAVEAGEVASILEILRLF